MGSAILNTKRRLLVLFQNENTMSQLDPNLFYDFDKLAYVCKELDFKYELLAEDEFKVIWCDDIYLVFANLVKEQANRALYSEYIDIDPLDNFRTTMVYNDYTHTHGIDIDIGFDPNTYIPYSIHYLDIPLLIRTGELLIYETYCQKVLKYQWLVHKIDLTPKFGHLEPGEEVRIIRA
ncbi:MAG: hypothetical protein K0R48_645 [Gammaproteobacteria bacterium]|jgi:hypothetical protein|nr:hypothetical protein [Gammaproteobacteria bacterium]